MHWGIIIQFVQQSNDTCLAYTLAAICNLLSETGISSTTGILGSSFSPLTSIGISLSVQQQLFVLLRGSLKRVENLKLKWLVASNHLAMARFNLTVSNRNYSIPCWIFFFSVQIFSILSPSCLNFFQKSSPYGTNPFSGLDCYCNLILLVAFLC